MHAINALEFGKNAQGDWQILQPKPMRADGSQIDELVRKLKDARLTERLLHFNYETLGQFLAKQRVYVQLEANGLQARGVS